MKRLTTGVYEDAHSIRGVVNIAAGRKEKRFPFGTPLREIKRWRNETVAKLEHKHPHKRAGAIGRYTFSADAKRYLTGLTIASWNSRRSELRAWEKRFGPKRRTRVTTDDVRAAIKAWTDAGVRPKTTVNRCRALTAMYHALDGADAWTPVDGVTIPKPQKRRPAYIDPALIIAVEARLRAMEAAAELPDSTTRGRFMVLTSTGARPVHMKRATAADVNLERRVWNVTAAKDGEPIELWLNDDMLAAWEVFIAAGAWGEFNSTLYAQTLRAAGWPADIRPYNAKHAVGKDLGERGVDMQVIADWFGHTKTETTRIYVPVLNSRIRRASEQMNGRLGWTPVAATGIAPSRMAVNVGNMSGEDRKVLIRQLLEELLQGS